MEKMLDVKTNEGVKVGTVPEYEWDTIMQLMRMGFTVEEVKA